MDSQIFILKPFNGVFFAAFALFAVIFTVLSICIRKKSDTFKRRFLAALMLLTLVGFIVYKIFLSVDTSYSLICEKAGKGEFNWWGELPLQLCNINMLLIPAAVLLKNRALESFCFFISPIGAGMALAMPGIGFDCYSIFLPRMLGFFGTHFMIFFGGLALCSFGIYKPSFRDMLPTVLSVTVLTTVIFAINMIMRLTGVHPHANYFFNVETEGNPILELFYSWIPLPFLYTLPCLLILLPYMTAVTLPFHIISRRKALKHGN